MPVVSVLTDVSQAVADLLNAQTFLTETQFTRGWQPVNDIEDAEGVFGTVVPNIKTASLQTRGGARLNTLVVDITVKRLHGDSGTGELAPVDRCDEVAAVAQQVEDFVSTPTNTVTDSNDVVWSAGEVQTEINDEMLTAHGIFEMRISVTYSAMR